MQFISDTTNLEKIKILTEKLDMQNNKFKKFFDMSSHLFVILDKDNNILEINQAWHILGWHEEDLIGKNIIDIIHPDNVDMLKHNLNMAALSGRDTLNKCLKLKTKDNRYITAYLDASYDNQTNTIYVVIKTNNNY